ncbi:GNAT family N-acetyltransferase [Helcococcus kunzii]|uniref:GNAT family N-acetyltransferase n=1 Tax=Helcococcus kunzii TaxID=40091 RepID=UPI0024AD42FF|nr:GNAT family N-acetyltransferase [Helcococcus kunzii]
MNYKFEKLNKENFKSYLDYLKIAVKLEPELMCSTEINEDELYTRLDDELNQHTTSILAILDDLVIGRIEYHFYACFQDGFRMCYVDWIYVLPKYRNQHIAKKLFEEMRKDCIENNIDEIRLIRATNKNAANFYNSFEDAILSELPFFRMNVK